MPAPAPRVPGELSDAILDHMHADPRALKTASLVCRAWLPTSRYHLFERLVLTPATATSVLAQLAPVAPYVRHLQLDLAGGDASLLPALVPRLAPLAHIESLALTGTALPPAAAPRLAAAFPALTALELRHVIPATRMQIPALLAALPRLERATLHELAAPGPGPAPPPGTLPPAPPRLHALRVAQTTGTAHPAADILQWLARAPAPLRTLAVAATHPQTLAALGDLLRAAPALDALTLEIDARVASGDLGGGFCDLVDPRANGALRSVELALPLHAAAGATLAAFAARLAAPRLEALTLVLTAASAARLDVVDWAALARALGALGGLRALVVRAKYPESEDIARVVAQRKLPALHARGILRFEPYY